jgi:hypothetical protein
MAKVIISRNAESGERTVIIERHGYHHRHPRITTESFNRLQKLCVNARRVNTQLHGDKLITTMEV